MGHFHRSRVLDVEQLRHLLDLTEHQVRALIANNDPGIDHFPAEIPKFKTRVGGHVPQAANKGAR